jgi:hypothetical protein
VVFVFVVQRHSADGVVGGDRGIEAEVVLWNGRVVDRCMAVGSMVGVECSMEVDMAGNGTGDLVVYMEVKVEDLAGYSSVVECVVWCAG